MILKRLMITYIADDMLKAKESILNVLKEIGIFEVELVENFSLNSLDYNENFDNNQNVWSIIFYLADNKYFSKKIDIIAEKMSILDYIIFDIYTSEIDTDTYKDEWKKSFRTTKITENIVINPSWLEYEKQDNEIVINIDPSMAFGTGTHETTALCIEMLEKYVVGKKTLIDIGCGSGILMLVASKLGVEKVIGVDIDKNCIDVVNENFKKNNLNNFEVYIGNLIDKENEKYDIVVSNILVDVLEKLLLDIRKILKNNSIVIFSGIINEKKNKFLEKTESIGLVLLEENIKNKWTSLVFRLEE